MSEVGTCVGDSGSDRSPRWRRCRRKIWFVVCKGHCGRRQLIHSCSHHPRRPSHASWVEMQSVPVREVRLERPTLLGHPYNHVNFCSRTSIKTRTEIGPAALYLEGSRSADGDVGIRNRGHVPRLAFLKHMHTLVYVVHLFAHIDG